MTMALISTEELRNRIRVTIPRQTPYRASLRQKNENISSFNGLSRTGVSYGAVEKRILLYETIVGEKVYMQYPGKESVRQGERHFPNDARPVLQKPDGTFIDDMDFKMIWDVIDLIGQGRRADIDILATIFLRIAYMLDYHHSEETYYCETVDVETGNVISRENVDFIWNHLMFDEDVFETLNDRFGTLNGISVEGFLYYNDLLAQNEDCKYSYLRNGRWDKLTGRINNCLSHLTVISHIRGYIGISKLIDSFQRTGVAPLPQSRFDEACGEMVRRV